jgi:hypothetical protein
VLLEGAGPPGSVRIEISVGAVTSLYHRTNVALLQVLSIRDHSFYETTWRHAPRRILQPCT